MLKPSFFIRLFSMAINILCLQRNVNPQNLPFHPTIGASSLIFMCNVSSIVEQFFALHNSSNFFFDAIRMVRSFFLNSFCTFSCYSVYCPPILLSSLVFLFPHLFCRHSHVIPQYAHHLLWAMTINNQLSVLQMLPIMLFVYGMTMSKIE